MNLADLQVLVVDCQTTGNRKDRDRLLEIAWLPLQAGKGRGQLHSYLLRQPPGSVLSHRIIRLTGIDAAALRRARSSKTVRRRFLNACRSVAAGQPKYGCPLVIHYARFETVFLKHLAGSAGSDAPLRQFILCTHEISRRLLPWLPRKGLHAVAGYFGCSLPAEKRAGPHVEATAVVWRHLVGLLAAEGVASTESLFEWMSRPPRNDSERRYPMPPGLLRKIPDGPGVYRMLRSNGDLLYIGKAQSLKKRVSSYFQRRRHPEGTLEMLTQAVDLQLTPTRSALEAALLETDEIKRCRPPYNRALQAGARSLWFCSRDFAAAASGVDRTHRLGPVPGREKYEVLHRLGWLLHDRPGFQRRWLSSGFERLALPEGRKPPDESSLQEGLQRFHRRYAGRCRGRNPWRSLVAAGARLWQERCLLPAEEEDGVETHDDWDGSAVLRYLESLLVQCAWGLRRARWFTLICESSLAWEDRDGCGWRVLVFQGGQLDACRRIAAAAVPPVPPGRHRSRMERKRCLNLQCYDRLRVFTTELRRLLADGRKLQLRVGGRAVLDPTRIAAALRWI